MRKSCVVLVLVSACGFAPTGLEVQADAQGSSSATPPGSAPADAPAQTTFAACHSQLPNLVLCFDFEDHSFAPTVHDSAGGLSATTANVDVMSRAGQQAAMVDHASSITVPEAPVLDIVGAVSVELWLDPTTAGQDDTVISHSADYGIDFDYAAGCYIGDYEAWAPNTLPSGWHHIACTFDGSTIETYVDGVLVACAQGQGRPTPHTAEIGISEQFSGGIDDVHVYSRALAPTEIQSLAGVTSGATSCPPPTAGSST